jgi:hypothetical protein
MKVSKNIYFNSLCVNLGIGPLLLEKVILKFFDKPGIVKMNYLEPEITSCTKYILEAYYIHMPLPDELIELINNINNLKLYD